ncbi:MAG TPA: hypothetical protein VFF27_09440 [Bacteroidia bacterium]|jgi:hypothetical protein|nr:hypothetical protein [Bacteroidia bacterium]
MKKTLFFLIISFTFSCKKDKYEEYYFIPDGYTGWVNIIFEDSTSHNEVIQSGNGYFHFIANNPLKYTVKSKIFPEGYYSSHFYYYSKDTLYEIFDETHQNIQIFNKGTSNFATSKNGFLSAKNGVKIVSFYVSSKAVTSNFDIKISENPINSILREYK